MKRLLNSLLIVNICFGLVACGGNSDAKNNGNTQTNNYSTQQDSIIDQNQQLQDERYGEGVNPSDVDFSQYTGVWYSKTDDDKIEFFEDGRIIFNDEVEYKWNNYDYKKRVSIYLGDTKVGVGYLNEDNGDFEMATELDMNLIGPYTREK